MGIVSIVRSIKTGYADISLQQERMAGRRMSNSEGGECRSVSVRAKKPFAAWAHDKNTLTKPIYST
jgi:hypothetical protein